MEGIAIRHNLLNRDYKNFLQLNQAAVSNPDYITPGQILHIPNIKGTSSKKIKHICNCVLLAIFLLVVLVGAVEGSLFIFKALKESLCLTTENSTETAGFIEETQNVLPKLCYSGPVEEKVPDSGRCLLASSFADEYKCVPGYEIKQVFKSSIVRSSTWSKFGKVVCRMQKLCCAIIK
jgi:hypothetical protein